jgi:hypothetical protein
VVDSVSVAVHSQRIANAEPWRNGFGWKPSFTYEIDLPSGIYLWGNAVPFVVTSDLDSLDLVVVYPSNTIAAYNRSGGRSLYGPSRTHRLGLAAQSLIENGWGAGLPPHYENRATAVSFQRTGGLTHWGFFQPFLPWALEQTDLRIGYIADHDLDVYDSIARARILMIMGHSEYWSRAARQNFDRFVADGGSAIVLSGNTMWWQVRYSEDGTRLISYKEGDIDPVDDPHYLTINWYDDRLEYSIIASIGGDFVHGGYGLTDEDRGWNGYRIIAPDSPLLANVELAADSIISMPSLEYDGAPLVWNGGSPQLDLQTIGAYRGELIGYDFGYRDGAETVGTFHVIQHTPSSGVVINGGSTNWTSHDGFGGRDSVAVRQITRNAIDILLSAGEVFSADALVRREVR